MDVGAPARREASHPLSWGPAKRGLRTLRRAPDLEASRCLGPQCRERRCSVLGLKRERKAGRPPGQPPPAAGPTRRLGPACGPFPEKKTHAPRADAVAFQGRRQALCLRRWRTPAGDETRCSEPGKKEADLDSLKS